MAIGLATGCQGGGSGGETSPAQDTVPSQGSPGQDTTPSSQEPPPVPATPDSNLAIYVLAGQSNMSGRDPTIPTDLPKNKGHLWNYTNAGAWQAAQEPVDDATDQVYAVSIDKTAGVGPGLSFADNLYSAYPHRDIGLVPCAKGGSTIEEWQRNLATDSLYGSCLARIREAQKHGAIEGVLFYQGESDTYSFGDADKWPNQFRQMVDSLRADLNDSSLPVVFAQLAIVLPPTADRLPAWDHLKTLQGGISKYKVAMVRTDDLSLYDAIHLDTPSQVELGKRFAQMAVDQFLDRVAK